jgi:hypothetical protein
MSVLVTEIVEPGIAVVTMNRPERLSTWPLSTSASTAFASL